jgi:hypothetical protein
MVLSLVALGTVERCDLMAPFTEAFKDAVAADGMLLKEAAFFMAIDMSQLDRQLSGREAFDVCRLARLFRERPSFADEFIPRLCKAYGGWRGVLSHGFAHLLVPFLPVPGQARMARASFPDPRKGDQKCGGGSWRESA